MAGKDTRPDIVLIQADQLHKNALGCYGNEAIETPNIDSIASEGQQFDNAYTPSPWCLPARASLATGLYPRNNGTFTNYAGWDGRMDPDLPNVYRLLKKKGYTTSHIGKVHYAPMPFNKQDPAEMSGYDKYRSYYDELGIDNLVIQDDKNVSMWCYDDYSTELEAAGQLEAYRDKYWDDGNDHVFSFPGPAEWHPDSWVGQKAIEQLEAYGSDTSSFTWISFSGPHWPFDPPTEYLDRVDVDRMDSRTTATDEYDDPDKIHYSSYHGCTPIRRIDANSVTDATKDYSEEFWRTLRQHYLANVVLIDDMVGEILGHIEDALGDDTLVIFVSDHGEMLGNHSLWGKHNCGYEDVLNVPLAIDGPDVESDRVSAMAMLTDVTATCLAAADVGIDDTDGVDLLAEEPSLDREYIVSEGGGFTAFTDGRYKYVQLVQEGHSFAELFDLESDSNELHNVIDLAEYDSELARIRNVLLETYMDAAITSYPRPPDL